MIFKREAAISGWVLAMSLVLCFCMSASAGESEFNECKQKLIKAQNLDLLYDLDWKPPRDPRVVVGPTFFTIPFDAKENFARTINCFLMAGKGGGVSFDLLDYRTDKRIGRFTYNKLKMD